MGKEGMDGDGIKQMVGMGQEQETLCDIDEAHKAGFLSGGWSSLSCGMGILTIQGVTVIPMRCRKERACIRKYRSRWAVFIPQRFR